MKKVLLLSCLISMTAHAGTGGGTSTPPAKAGLAKSLAESLKQAGNNILAFRSTEPLPVEITLEISSTEAPRLDRSNEVTVQNLLGATRSYRIYDGDDAAHVLLKDRRETMRAATR